VLLASAHSYLVHNHGLSMSSISTAQCASATNFGEEEEIKNYHFKNVALCFKNVECVILICSLKKILNLLRIVMLIVIF
jgi:tRNA A37 threonylcarbamoyltransferase TsaD